jgi:hypothetical protein
MQKERAINLFAAAIYCLMALCFRTPVEAKEKEDVSNRYDFTPPLTRVDVRLQYQNSPPSDNDNYYITTLRVDKPIRVSKAWSLVTRLDLPLLITDAMGTDDRNGDYKFGLGDILVQGLFINKLTQRFAWGFGTQLIFPTATKEQMGDGKYEVLPTAVFRVTTPEITKGSWVALLVRYGLSFAGDDDRADIKEIQFAPTYNLSLPHSWFVALYPSSDIRYNLGDQKAGDTGRWFVPLDLMVGKMLSQSIIGSVEVGFPIINEYPLYDFKIEGRLGFFF